MDEQTEQPESAFRFHGRWQEFVAILLPNILLTLVTLGIYRFWATTREREYLWAKTEFIDERLEWTGKGIELFIGFLMAFFLIGLPLLFLQFGMQAMMLQGYTTAAIMLAIVAFVLIFYLTGIAFFRALRYRLSRTYWRGIRGGSNDPGLRYGLAYLGKNIVSMLTLFILWPWAQVSLWNERWNAMSFGPHSFVSTARWQPLMRRYMLFYLVPFMAFVGIVIMAITVGQSGNPQDIGLAGGLAMIGFVIFLLVAFYVLLPIGALLFFSKYYRNAVGALRLHDLEFAFTARAADWILFALANLAIWAIAGGIAFAPLSAVIQAATPAPGMPPQLESWSVIAGGVATLILMVLLLGLAGGLVRYRSWKFFITHMEAYGEVNLDDLTQSATASPRQGEGLLDAFDVGAI